MRASLEVATVAAIRRYRPDTLAGRLNLILPCETWARSEFCALDWRSHAEHAEVYFGPEGCDGDNMLRDGIDAELLDAVVGLREIQVSRA